MRKSGRSNHPDEDLRPFPVPANLVVRIADD